MLVSSIDALQLPTWVIILIAIIIAVTLVILIVSSAKQKKQNIVNADLESTKADNDSSKKDVTVNKTEKKEPVKAVDKEPAKVVPIENKTNSSLNEKEEVKHTVVEEKTIKETDEVKPIEKEEKSKEENTNISNPVQEEKIKEEEEEEEKTNVYKEENKTIVEPTSTAKKNENKEIKKKANLVSITQTKDNKPFAGEIVKKIKTSDEEETTETFGKFTLVKTNNSDSAPYNFRLIANNGQILFESEGYKTKPRKASIDAFKKHVANGEFIIDSDKQGTFRFKLYKSDGRTLLGVGETYKTKESCESSINSVKRFAETANLIEDLTIEEE